MVTRTTGPAICFRKKLSLHLKNREKIEKKNKSNKEIEKAVKKKRKCAYAALGPIC
jgi:hypothetical protein